MPAPEDLLAELATAPPVAPTPVGQIRARARRRVWRRRAGLALAALVVALGVGVTVGLALDGDLGEDVVADGGAPPSPPDAVSSPGPTGGGPDAATSEPGVEPGEGTDPGNGPAMTPEAVVAGPVDGLRDGGRLLVTLTGVETAAVATVEQCSRDDLTRCSQARGRTVTVEHGPETQLTFTAFHDIAVVAPGAAAPAWEPCAPCAVVVRLAGIDEPVAVVPLTIGPTDAPIRPTIRVEPAGPHRPGGAVTATIDGLQPSEAVRVCGCVVAGATCRLVGDATEVIADDDGRAVAAAVALPDGTLDGVECVTVPGACGLGAVVVEDDALAAAPLDLRG